MPLADAIALLWMRGKHVAGKYFLPLVIFWAVCNHGSDQMLKKNIKIIAPPRHRHPCRCLTVIGQDNRVEEEWDRGVSKAGWRRPQPGRGRRGKGVRRGHYKGAGQSIWSVAVKKGYL